PSTARSISNSHAPELCMASRSIDSTPLARTTEPGLTALGTAHSVSEDEPGPLAAFGALLLLASLIAALFWAWANPAPQGAYNLRQGMVLLGGGQYSAAAALYESMLPLYDSPDVRLGLSYAYLARRDGERAERQVRSALSAAPPDLKPAVWAQLGRVLAFAG